MDAHTAHTNRKRRRDRASLKTNRVRAVVVSGAVLGSLAVAGGLTVQAVAATAAPTTTSITPTTPSTTKAPGTARQANPPKGHAAPLVAPATGQQSHATTQGS